MNASSKLARTALSPQSSHCLLITIEPVRLLVPRTLVAEIIKPDGLTFSSSLNRHIKIFEWRGFLVPLLNPSVISEQCREADVPHKIILLHGLSRRDKLPYYALPASRNPQVIQISTDTMTKHKDGMAAAVHHVLLKDGEAIIPAVDHIETYLYEHCFNEFRSTT